MGDAPGEQPTGARPELELGQWAGSTTTGDIDNWPAGPDEFSATGDSRAAAGRRGRRTETEPQAEVGGDTMCYASILLVAVSAVVVPHEEQCPPIRLADAFPRRQAPGTGRRVVQLTSGEGFTYPLYFYIPSITRNGRWLIYHRAAGGQVQLHRLDLTTGQSVQLTHATCPDTQWRPWCVDSGRGVLDHRSVLNVARNLVVYFDGTDVRAVDVQTLQDRRLFQLPADREAYGQNTVTPDGRWLIYIHVPRGSIWGKPCRGAVVAAYDFDSGHQRELCRIDSAVFHVTAYDNEHFLVTHPADHPGMLWTDMTSGKLVPLRDGDPGATGHVVHCQVTRRGIVYEVPEVRRAGLYDPFTRRRFEFPWAKQMQYVHTGRDPEGRLWFYENSTAWDRFDTHDLWWIRCVDRKRGVRWERLTGTWPTYGGGQKAHFHPQLTPDRRWIMFTAGDPATKTNHIFLLDVSDLPDTKGIDQHLLSETGANDLAP